MKISRNFLINIITFVFSGFLGILAILFPVLVLFNGRIMESPLFPLLRTGIEKFSLLSVGSLFAAGFILGWLRPVCPYLWGLGTMSLLPVAAFLEMTADPTSHNLWPLEFFFYGVISVIPVGGSYLGATVKKTIRREK